MKERLGTLHNKAGNTHTAYNSVKEREKKKDRGEMKRNNTYLHLSSLNRRWLMEEKAFHRRAAWSKGEFVQSNFILTFLAFFSSKHNPPPVQQSAKPIHGSMWFTGL